MARLQIFLAKNFYFCMALLFPVIVIYGFSHTIDFNLIHAHPSRPAILTWHSALFSLWILFFILQSGLIRIRKTSTHKLIGWFGVALGTAMVIIGFSTAIAMANFHMKFPNPGQPPSDAFLIIPVSDIFCFAVLFTLAVLYRGRPEWHRRFMLLCTIVITNAAFGRFPDVLVGATGSLAVWWVDGLIVLGMLRDLIVQKRIHPIYLWTLPCIIAIQQLAGFCLGTQNPTWMRISHALMSI